MAALVNEENLSKILNDKSFNDEIIAFLNAIIDEELEKAPEETDCDLIDECADMILEIEQSKDSGLAVIVPLISSKEIMAKCSTNSFKRLSRTMQAVIVACIILLSGLTANAAVYKISGINIVGEVASAVSEQLEKLGVISSKKDDTDEELTRATRKEITTSAHSTASDARSQAHTGKSNDTERIRGKLAGSTTETSTEKITKETTTEETAQETATEEKTTANVTTTQPPIATYRLYFDPNGGECDIESKEVYFGKEIGELPVATRTGYEFRGWYNKKLSHNPILTSIATQVKPTTGYMLTEDATVKAKWAEIVTIRIDPNGGECDVTEIQCAVDRTPNLPTPTREGWVFDGWYYNGKPLEEVTEITDYHNIVFVAHWVPDIRIWKMIFNPNGGTCDEETKTVILYEPYGTLPTPKRNGYLFLGWYTGDNINSTKITETSVHNDRSDITVNAIWTRATYTMYFDAAGGECEMKSKNLYEGQPLGELPVPTRPGYKFDGWYYNNQNVNADTTLKANGNITLKARWTAASFTVKYDAGEGMFSTGSNTMSKSYTYMKKYGTLPVAYRALYTFDGWYTEPEGGTRIESTDTVLITENTTFYAHWTAMEGDIATITFHSNSTSDKIVIMSYSKGDKLGSVKPASSNSYCTFLGWYTDPLFGIKVSEDTPINSDMVLYAHWNPKFSKATLELEKTVYEVGEEIDPATVRFKLFVVDGTFVSETLDNMIEEDAYCRFNYDTSTPGEHTVTLQVAYQNVAIFGNIHIEATETITVVEPEEKADEP